MKFCALLLSLMVGVPSFGASLAEPACDDRQAEDIATEAYGKLHVDGGYQIDYVKLNGNPEIATGSYEFEVRICQTNGYSKCGGPTHFGVTYRVNYRPTHFGDLTSNRRCLVSLTAIGN